MSQAKADSLLKPCGIMLKLLLTTIVWFLAGKFVVCWTNFSSKFELLI